MRDHCSRETESLNLKDIARIADFGIYGGYLGGINLQMLEIDIDSQKSEEQQERNYLGDKPLDLHSLIL